MNSIFQKIVSDALSAESIDHIEDIQSLWSGYGKIMRYGLNGCSVDSVVIKYVNLPDQVVHPRGWNTDTSHQRKIKSYHVESAWYREWSHLCGDDCRVPSCFALEEGEGEFLIVLEDLDASGFPLRKTSISIEEIQICLSWLASFHAVFMGKTPSQIWSEGTYWHLATRGDEWSAMEDGELKQIASELDSMLSTAPFQTIVHGDAKLANFCFSEDGNKVAAVDFQYVGGGCGMKDVAYFIGSCLNEDECEAWQEPLLNHYFTQLKMALSQHQAHINADKVEACWRPLYAVAWTDFYRFLKGWSPEHWKIHRYSDRLAHEVTLKIQSN
ncbi:MAG: phosphotransferase [Gammaproteobacteria bacterium]|nr:phosphotransferase [Gammaproteobacteria bacterium]